MEFTVYILYSHIVKRFYAGQTDNFNLRLERHNQGIVKTTKPGVPWIRVWTISLGSRSEALKLERKIKKRGISRFMSDANYDWESMIRE